MKGPGFHGHGPRRFPPRDKRPQPQAGPGRRPPRFGGSPGTEQAPGYGDDLPYHYGDLARRGNGASDPPQPQAEYAGPKPEAPRQREASPAREENAPREEPAAGAGLVAETLPEVPPLPDMPAGQPESEHRAALIAYMSDVDRAKRILKGRMHHTYRVARHGSDDAARQLQALQERAALLSAAREQARNALHALNREIRDQNRARHTAHPPRVERQFMWIARERLDEAVFAELLAAAEKAAADTPPADANTSRQQAYGAGTDPAGGVPSGDAAP